ncbi:DUF2157 domain-containing protein [Demequina capsici]|uniref:DUF2157 domain-containing protein n=1 Tax=Demequina capsici TaxID=3075620 RepID=A0AA96F4Z7_9MICO|nr:DUF2157 domain-containing protein [Demequina sp. OYTSA14]WNM23213.1 DUF2157 domain-containing protein [Demequina sp. OYTSA14]
MGARQDRFDEWVEAGLLETSTADALRAYEAGHGRDAVAPVLREGAASTEPEAERADRGPVRGLVGEILGYLGAVLAITAISFIVSQTWPSISTPGRVALVAGLTAIVAVAGVVGTRSPQDPAQRLASVLLFATVVCFGWLAWVSVDAAGLRDEVAGLWTFVAAGAVACIIYVWRRRALAELALLAATVGIAATTIEILNATDGMIPGLVIGAVGAAWLGLGVARIVTPSQPALVAGGLVLLFAVNTITSTDGTRGLALSVGVLLAIAMLTLAVMRRELLVLMIPGGIGLLSMMPQLIEHYVGGAVATWTAVLATGVALIVVAVRMLRGPRPD